MALLDPTGNIFTFFSKKRVLITGARGYIATNLIHSLCQIECTVLRLSRPGSSLPSIDCTARLIDVSADVRDPDSWAHVLEDTDVVFHLAAQTSAYAANEDPTSDHRANVLPVLFLLETCRTRGRHPIVLFSSTVTAVGIPTSLPVDETHANHPTTMYDLHKVMAEDYLKYYSEQGFVRGISLRLSNVYGPGPRSSRADRGILNGMIRKALKGEALSVYGEGTALRDYVYVDDVAQALLLAAEHADSLSGHHFIISSGVGHTLAQAANLVAERVSLKTGRKVPVQHIPPPDSLSTIEARNFVGNPRRFTDATGWRPEWTLSAGIDRTAETFS